MNVFQESLAHALLAAGEEAPQALRDLVAQPGFAVYRNTVLKGCIDALEANFPSVAQLVGAEWFRSAALAYVRAQPPRDGRLLVYGDEDFGAFVQAVPTAAGLPYLDGLARLDALWRASHAAADAPVLAADVLAGLDAQALAARVLRPHPAARWAWFEDLPVAALWMRQRTGGTSDDELPWQGDGLLLTRGDGAVQWAPLPRAGCVLLDVCAQGAPLGEAAAQALASDPATDLGPVLARLLAAGAFTSGPTVGFTSFTTTLQNPCD